MMRYKDRESFFDSKEGKLPLFAVTLDPSVFVTWMGHHIKWVWGVLGVVVLAAILRRFLKSKKKKTNGEEITHTLTKEELQFLPAALEIIETPPSPIGRALIWLLISLFVIALTWSIVGRIDEVAVAAGKVIPSGYTKIVQAEDKGIVSKIYVESGTPVKEGDLLIELDTVMTEADVARLKKERDFYRLTLRRLTAEGEEASFDLTGLEDCDVLEKQRQERLYTTRMEDFANRVRVAEKSIAQSEENLKQAEIQHEKLEIQVKMAKEREQKTRTVAEKGGISKFTWQEYLEKYLSLKQDLSSQKSEILRCQEILAQSQAELRRIIDEQSKDLSTQIVDVSHNLRVTEEELKKALEKHRLAQIRSPIAGTVQQLEIHTTGAVVTAAQPLMQVVPEGEGLKFEVWAINRDIGFIHGNQDAEIKVETFNFQKYGTLPAVVETVATEAVEDEQRGLIYRVLLSSEKNSFLVEDKEVSLLPGMAVTAEIKTRQKRVIEYFLEPFKTYMSEGLRER
jgi:hemolysin D